MFIQYNKPKGLFFYSHKERDETKLAKIYKF